MRNYAGTQPALIGGRTANQRARGRCSPGDSAARSDASVRSRGLERVGALRSAALICQFYGEIRVQNGGGPEGTAVRSAKAPRCVGLGAEEAEGRPHGGHSSSQCTLNPMGSHRRIFFPHRCGS